MSNKLALIFGGSRGIGAACVHALGENGFDVAYTYITSAPTGAQPGAGRTRSYQADVSAADQVEKVFINATADFGRAPDCVVANAGINVPPAPVAQFDPAQFRRLIEVNVVGAFNVLRAAAQRVTDGGTIIGVTTSLVRHAAAGIGPYSATKAAVECLLRSMAKELAARKVRVNGVAPGPVDTDLFRAGKTDEAKARSAAMSPFNRIGTSAEIAEVVAFLLSSKASWLHGQVVQPNGGLI